MIDLEYEKLRCVFGEAEGQWKYQPKRKHDMFKILKNGRTIQVAGQRVFKGYERARQALRKYIRKNVAAGKLSNKDFGFWDSISRNPANFTGAGFGIRKVA